ncbi:carbonic anhydrase [Iningainema tapete]|uniref:carbonic anhydrase n=1 Tax=Iningainema tapete BLCC-T55 TaxID=2748662 RepID=A0A8J6XLC6_9CYAN|nr:carbonic anhydrase [Iningainema tapete]MBD2776888.1 carbonic anhydrase [Iningainema tapete BLCC-T55]
MSRINGIVGRRNLLKLVGAGGATMAVSSAGILFGEQQAVAQKPSTPEKKPQPVNPDAALKRLMEGNKRFVDGKSLKPNQSRLRLQETSVAQYPFAAILGCADSRVPAEIVFDQGLGDLFVVRDAGNVASPTAIGSLEFATAVLGVQLVMVLGHARCGAVIAAVKGDPLPGRIGVFVEEIKPAVEKVRLKTGNLEENSVMANVQYQVERLREGSTILGNLVKEGKLKIVGGRYDLASGKLSMLT